MIWFLSREGEYLYELYSRVKTIEQEEGQVLWISRDLCLQQLIYEVARQNLSSDTLAPLSARDVLHVCSKLGYNSIANFSHNLTFGEYIEFSGLKPTELFRQIDLSESLAYKNYREYLIESTQGDLSILVYDVGWSGTMQYCLQCLLRLYVSEAVELEGIYLATFESRFPVRTRGIICNDAQPVDAFRAIKHCVEIVEILHCSCNGRVVGVAHVDGLWAPVREGFHELGEHLEKVLQYRRVWDSVFEAIYFSDEKDHAIRNLFRLLMAPSRQELYFFGDLHYLSNVGEFEGRALAQPVCGVFYLLRPDRLLRDYKASFWRLGFYRRLPFLYRFLLRILMPDLRFGR